MRGTAGFIIYIQILRVLSISLILNPIKAGGGSVWRPPPSSFFCPSTLICDTITVKFFDFS